MPSSTSGVPKLSPSVCPFSMSIDERVPLNMGTGGIFSRKGSIVDFLGVGKIFLQGGPKEARLHFHHSKLRKQPFFAKIDRKMSNFKILVRPWPPLPKPMPLKLLMIRLRKITKIYLLISMQWFLKTIFNYFYFNLWTRHEVHRAQARTICTTQIDNNRHRTFCIGVGGRTTGIPILVR